MKILLKTFKESWKVLKNKKTGILFGLEFLFFLLLTLGILVTLTSVSDRFQEIKTLQGTLDVESQNFGQLFANLSLLSNIVDSVFKTMGIFFVFLVILFGFFMSLIWKVMQNMLIKEKVLNSLDKNYFFKFLGLVLVWFLILGLSIYLIFKYAANYDWLILLIIVFLYFMWINASYFVFKKKLFVSLFEGFELAIDKFYIFIPMFLVFFGVMIGSSYVFNLVQNGFASFLGMIWGVFLFVWFKLWLLIMVRETGFEPAKTLSHQVSSNKFS